MQHVKLLAALIAGLACTAASAEPWVSMKTSVGEIVLELDKEKAPITVANFIAYTKSGFYTNTVFHRVIDGFMIQGGGYAKDLKQKPTRKAIKNESNNGLSNLAYTISMARESHPDTATSQWFINVKDNTGLDYPNFQGSGYTVFGKVVKGKDVVDKIKKVVVDDPNPVFKNVPVVPITVKSVTILKAPPPGIEVAPEPKPEPAVETPPQAPAPAEQTPPPAEAPAKPVQ